MWGATYNVDPKILVHVVIHVLTTFLQILLGAPLDKRAVHPKIFEEKLKTSA